MKTNKPNAVLCRSLGVALKATRKAHPISIDRLSAASGVAMSCISLIERGDSNPTIDTIDRLASALGTTPANILRQAEHYRPEAAAIKAPLFTTSFNKPFSKQQHAVAAS